MISINNFEMYLMLLANFLKHETCDSNRMKKNAENYYETFGCKWGHHLTMKWVFEEATTARSNKPLIQPPNENALWHKIHAQKNNNNKSKLNKITNLFYVSIEILFSGFGADPNTSKYEVK